MESRILLQKSLQQASADAADITKMEVEKLPACDKLLHQLLQARRQLMGFPDKADNVSKEELFQSEYEICRDQWKEVLNRRHQDLKLHAGPASTSKTQFRVLDSSFWQQVESTVAHEEMRQRSKEIQQQNSQENNNDEEKDKGEEEEFQDHKVYQQMLKDFLTAAASSHQNTVDGNVPRRCKSPKTKHQVDRKASKGRKIRYIDIPKFVNFTFPISKESKTGLKEDEWFQSLFGGAVSNSA